jgi:hypothetical protein
MIREYAPIPLIPAAWIMTFLTIIYPEISTYWIRHMHYFMTLFLTVFTILSWKQMNENPVLDIWRKIIAAGIIFTSLGALSFEIPSYQTLLGSASLTYWFIAPGIGLHQSAKEMTKYSSLYQKLGIQSIIAFAIFITGIYTESSVLKTLAIATVATTQTISMLTASKLDKPATDS